jgi:NTE family protein
MTGRTATPAADDEDTLRAASEPALSAALRVALVLAAASQMVMAFTSTATNIAFPEIAGSFATPRTTLVWGITGFAIVQASLVLLFGRVADRAGRTRVFRWGLVVFVAASLATAGAMTGELFVAARLAQAAGAAMIVPSALAIVLDEFPADRRIWVASITAGIMAVGQSASPTVASALMQWTGWRAVYVWPAVLCLVIGVMSLRVFRRSVPESPGARLDITGVVLGTAGVAGLAYAFTEGPGLGWTDVRVVGAIMAGGVLLPALVVRSLHHRAPLLDPRVFRHRSVWSASVVTLLTSAVGLGLWITWPLLLTQGLGYSPFETGLLLTPAPVTMALAAFAAGRLVDRIGPRLVVVVGIGAWVGAVAYLLAQLDTDAGVWTLLPAMTVGGIGWGCTGGPITGLALSDVRPSMFGQTTAIVNTLRFVGSAFGSAIAIGFIGDAANPSLAAFDRVHVLFLVLALASGLLSATLLPRHVSPPAGTVATAPSFVSPDDLAVSLDPVGVTQERTPGSPCRGLAPGRGLGGTMG